MPRDRYEPINTMWPENIPPLTRAEARKASCKLMRHFAKKKSYGRVRRCWIAKTPPFNQLHRGWRRLVHDVSHRAFEILFPNTRPHSGCHAHIEREMAEYVIGKGWLTGILKPAPRPFTRKTPNDKLESVLAAMKRWETKKKRAETAIKKLRRKAAYYNRIIPNEVANAS